MKTSELTGAALDWAVAKCLEKTVFAVEKLDCIVFKDNDWNVFNPSTSPSIGLPIIEANFIDIQFFKSEGWASSMAPHFGHVYKGPTLLIAAMRCYVASKMGADVDLPEGLT